jgi:rhomboid protease GluP
MSLAQNEEMIQALAAKGADDAFDERILPGSPWSNEHLSNPHAGDAPGEGLAVDGIPIAEHISRSGLLREGLENLAGGPVGRRVIRDVEVEEFAAIVAENDEDKEKAEGEGGDHEEVDGNELSGMRGEKGTPGGRRPRRRPVHVLGDGQLGDLVAEQGEFRLDAPPAPCRILPRHTSDEAADLGVESRPAQPVPGGAPAPVELEALAVPAENGRGLNDEEIAAPTRPQARQPDPEDPIPTGEPGSGDGSLKDQQLVAKRKVLEGDRLRVQAQGAEEGPETNHEDHLGTPRHQVWRLCRDSTGISAGGGEVSSGGASTTKFLTGTGVIAALLVGFFAVTGPRGPNVWFDQGSASARPILSGEVWRTVTALTLHADLAHVLSNAIACLVFITAVAWWFGPGVGTWLVLLAGAGGNALTALAHGPSFNAVGASTAIFGALGILASRQFVARRQGRGSGHKGWVVIAASLALLGMLGTAPGSDVLAHVFGLLVGGLLGIGPALAQRRPLGRSSQWVLALAAGALVLACWRLALVAVRPP